MEISGLETFFLVWAWFWALNAWLQSPVWKFGSKMYNMNGVSRLWAGTIMTSLAVAFSLLVIS